MPPGLGDVPAMNFSPTAVRVATAVILIPGVVAAVWWGSTGLVAGFAGLVTLLALAWELPTANDVQDGFSHAQKVADSAATQTRSPAELMP